MNKSELNYIDALEASNAKYRMVDMEEAIRLLATVDIIALDFETTALWPTSGKIRLTSICCDSFHIVIDHFIHGHFRQLIPHLRGKQIWVYNAKFETTWCDYYEDDDTPYGDLLEICDVDFLAKAYLGGHPSSLAKMVLRDLKIAMKKDEQLSDWSQFDLRKDQLDYAAFDSHVTWELFLHWDEKLSDEQFEAAMFVFNYSVRGTSECENTGLYLDYDLHSETVRMWKLKQATFERYLRRYTPKDVIDNLNSDVQIGKYLETILDKPTLAVWPKTPKAKRMQFEGKYLRSVSRQFPYPFSRWLAALAGFKYYNKYLSTYGDTILNKSLLTGKVTSRFNIAQAITGRYSSSTINLQNIPRKVVVRRAFVSPPLGEVETPLLMCLADYKGIEIRVLAELTQDEQLLEDVIYGDVHAASCAQIYDHDYDYVREVLASDGEGRFANIYPVIKEQRSKAKGFTFQLLYGAGAGALSDVLRCSYDEAVDAINAWSARYSAAYGFRNTQFDHMMSNNGFLLLHDHRTIKVPHEDRTMPVAANYGVQGTAASVMYRAVGRTHQYYYETGVPAWLAASVHDEMLTYAEDHAADEAMGLQNKAMTDAWLDIFPKSNTDNLTDYAIGTSWAAKP